MTDRACGAPTLGEENWETRNLSIDGEEERQVAVSASAQVNAGKKFSACVFRQGQLDHVLRLGYEYADS